MFAQIKPSFFTVIETIIQLLADLLRTAAERLQEFVFHHLHSQSVSTVFTGGKRMWNYGVLEGSVHYNQETHPILAIGLTLLTEECLRNRHYPKS